MSTSSRHLRRRRAFTMIEVIVASMVTVLVLGSMTTSISQLARSKNTCKRRLDAHMRADAALVNMRRDIASIIRSDDLFFTRFLLYDDAIETRDGTFHRDELLIFNTRLRPVRTIDNFTGEGMEYETQYRIEEDELGPVLWQRRDTVPDEYEMGGGIATPLVEGVVSLMIEAYDGRQWYQQWDSDIDGLPLAVRITIGASGHRLEEDAYDAPIAYLRTVVPIDRVLPPRDILDAEEEALEELDAEAAGEEAGEGEDEELLPGIQILPDGSIIETDVERSLDGSGPQLPDGVRLPDGVELPDGVTIPPGGGTTSPRQPGGGKSPGGGGNTGNTRPPEGGGP